MVLGHPLAKRNVYQDLQGATWGPDALSGPKIAQKVVKTGIGVLTTLWAILDPDRASGPLVTLCKSCYTFLLT